MYNQDNGYWEFPPSGPAVCKLDTQGSWCCKTKDRKWWVVLPAIRQRGQIPLSFALHSGQQHVGWCPLKAICFREPINSKDCIIREPLHRHTQKSCFFKKRYTGNSLDVQWLGLQDSTAEDTDLIPGWGTNQHAAWPKKKKKKERKKYSLKIAHKYIQAHCDPLPASSSALLSQEAPSCPVPASPLPEVTSGWTSSPLMSLVQFCTLPKWSPTVCSLPARFIHSMLCPWDAEQVACSRQVPFSLLHNIPFCKQTTVSFF